MNTMADTPPAITTPNSVETRGGSLDFERGLPAEKTVTKRFDELDFQRAVLLSSLPIAGMEQLIRTFTVKGDNK
jgi:hypothetical protein